MPSRPRSVITSSRARVSALPNSSIRSNFSRVAPGPPVRVVEVLPPPGVVGADRLQVPVGVRRDPHVGPRRRDHQGAHPLRVLVGQPVAVPVEVDEAPARPPPGPARLVGRRPAKPHHAGQVASRRASDKPDHDTAPPSSHGHERSRPSASTVGRCRCRCRGAVAAAAGFGSIAAADRARDLDRQHVGELTLGADVHRPVGRDRDPLALLLRGQPERSDRLVAGERVDRRAAVVAHDVVAPVGEERRRRWRSRWSRRPPAAAGWGGRRTGCAGRRRSCRRRCPSRRRRAGRCAGAAISVSASWEPSG